MAHNKSPCLDGFPAEFYLKFWPVLGEDYVAMVNECFDLCCLSVTQRHGLITLLFKQGDCALMNNWRPITLLCVDYEIISKLFANCLLCVIASVTTLSQTCGIPGHMSAGNVRLLKNLVHYANEKNIGGSILSLDQEKAFDRVEWSFIVKVLQGMKFGKSFIQ
jgi:hypothetical protein